MFKICSLE